MIVRLHIKAFIDACFGKQKSGKFHRPKQDCAIGVLEGMLLSVYALVGREVSISGVDVIVYSWLRVISGTSTWRISVNNVRAFVVFYAECAENPIKSSTDNVKNKTLYNMSNKFENELVALLEMRYTDDPYNHTYMYRNFFGSNEEELKKSSIWNEIKNLASEVLAYKVRYGESDIVDEFVEEMKLHYDLWAKI